LEDIVGKKEKGDNTRDWYLPLLNRKVSLASRPANLEDSPISAYVAGGAFNRPIRRGLSVGEEFADRPPLILLILLFQS
jgi:hypothetical protein